MATPGYFIVECNPDQLLVEVLFNARKREINHAGDRGRVLKALRRREGAALGVVDEDPDSGTSLEILLQRERFQEINEEDDEYLGIRRFKYGEKMILALQPNLEGWTIRMARACGIRLKDYGLPEDPDELHSRINNNLESYRRLLRDLVECKRLKGLKRIISGGM